MRALLVPFSVPKAGVAIADFEGSVEERIQIPDGEYALVFELKLRNDEEYLSSPRYQEDVDGGFTEECCYLAFYPRIEPMQAEILRLDAWSSPPYQLQGYSPLKPIYPLLMDVGPSDRYDF